MKKIFTFIFIFNISILTLFAGPFGIEFGWTKEQLENSGVEILYESKLAADTSGLIITPTQTHNTFSTYLVYIDSEYGIYEIAATSNSTRSSIALKREYDSLVEQLTRNYGQPLSIDYTAPDSIWTDPSDLIYGIYIGERTILSTWTFEAEKGTDLSFIGYGILSDNPTEGFSRIEYYSKDSDLIDLKMESVL